MILSLVIFGTAIIIDIFYTYWIAKKTIKWDNSKRIWKRQCDSDDQVIQERR